MPKPLFVVVCSYASALTIWLLFSLSTTSSKPHPLEYLPDLAPRIENGKAVLRLVPEEADVAPGHTLRLGEEGQFGHLVVKPLEVTRGNVEFEHYDDRGRTRPSEGPVLKLRLELQNVSRDQRFPPLGKELLLRRAEDAEHPGRFRANNFVCQVDQKRRDGRRFLTFELLQESDWDLKDQEIERSLGPEETFTTYIPSQPGVEGLSGELVWRVHLRIGYNPKTHHGVTTLVEVKFDSDEIRTET